MKLISKSRTRQLLLFIFGSLLIFHFLIMFEFIPYDIVWGGQLKSKEQMIQFEIISIVLNFLMLTAVFFSTKAKKGTRTEAVLRVAFWLMCALFVLNTVGNLFSENQFEMLAFTPLTAVLAFLTMRMAINR